MPLENDLTKIRRVAVLIPGIMGSSLAYTDAGKVSSEIWGENFYDNYKRLLSNPTLLRWNDIKAEASFLENIYLLIPRLPKHRLWKKLFEYLSNHGEFQKKGRTLKFAYDWRESLLSTAEVLGSFLEEYVQQLAKSENGNLTDYRFVFLTHSMGGLLVRVAIGKSLIKSQNIDRIIHIGSPLQGAPAAFRSLYGKELLPWLSELTTLFKWKNADLFFEHLLDNVRTFPSLYQLLPPKGHSPYLYYSAGQRGNPLSEPYIPLEYQRYANDAHAMLEKAEQVIIENKVKCFTIYTETHNQEKTDVEYRVRPLAPPATGYQIMEAIGRTAWGDGTVPFESACGSLPSCKQNPVKNVTHAFMCNNNKVVDLLHGILR